MKFELDSSIADKYRNNTVEINLSETDLDNYNSQQDIHIELREIYCRSTMQSESSPKPKVWLITYNEKIIASFNYAIKAKEFYNNLVNEIEKVVEVFNLRK